MLRNVLIVSHSGIVLFTKEFIKVANKGGLIGQLVTAMLEFSILRVGIPVSYIALSNVGVAIHSNAGARVTCVLFFDITDGEDFGKLIAGEILNAFVSTYDSTLEEKKISPDAFNDFGQKLTEIIRNSVRPVLDNLQQQRGIECCVLVHGDNILHSTQADVDKLMLMANHQALLGAATDIMASKNDITLGITLKGARTTTVLRRIERASLLVLYSNAVNSARSDAEINKAARILSRVLNMLSNLQDVLSYR